MLPAEVEPPPQPLQELLGLQLQEPPRYGVTLAIDGREPLQLIEGSFRLYQDVIEENPFGPAHLGLRQAEMTFRAYQNSEIKDISQELMRSIRPVLLVMRSLDATVTAHGYLSQYSTTGRIGSLMEVNGVFKITGVPVIDYKGTRYYK